MCVRVSVLCKNIHCALYSTPHIHRWRRTCVCVSRVYIPTPPGYFLLFFQTVDASLERERERERENIYNNNVTTTLHPSPFPPLSLIPPSSPISSHFSPILHSFSSPFSSSSSSSLHIETAINGENNPFPFLLAFFSSSLCAFLPLTTPPTPWFMIGGRLKKRMNMIGRFCQAG